MRRAAAGLLLGAAGLAAAPPPLEDLARLRAGPVPVRVTLHGASPATGRRLLHVARVALPVLEEVLGAPLPARPDVPLDAYPDPDRRGDEESHLDHAADRLVILEATSDAVVVHELAHLWLRAERFVQMMGSERWAAEGLAHWAARRVLQARPQLGDAAEFHRVLMQETWGAQPGWDEPLAGYSPAFPVDPAERGPRLAFYGKAYAFFDACERRAGAAAMTRAVGALLAAAPVDSAAVLAALDRARLRGDRPGELARLALGPAGAPG